MKPLVGLLLCAGILWACCAAWGAESEAVPLGVRDFTHSESHLSVTRVSAEQTTVSLVSPTIVTQNTIVDYQSYQAFGIEGEPYLLEDGGPTVPQVTRYYRIPNTGSADLIITNAEYDVVENINALPRQKEAPSFAGLQRNEAVYTKDAWYPEQVVVMSDPMIMRDFRVVTVTLYPVQVNPVTHQARIYRNLSADVVANNRPGLNELSNPHRISRDWASIYRGNIANLDDQALDNMTVTPGSLMILTSTNSVPRPFADSLARWKTRMGYTVTVDARATWSAAQAINDIRAAYASAPMDKPLEYVVLMGDPGTTWAIPVDNTNNSYDHSYAMANTGDDMEDIGVGRLSGGDASTLAVINAKIMGYERTPHVESSPGVADTMWFHKAFLYACLYHSCADNGLLMQWGRQQFIHHSGVTLAEYASHPQVNVVQSDITSRLNPGVGFFLWRGAMSGGMPTSTPDNCNTGWRLPITMTITCFAADYVRSGINSPAEGFLCDGTVSMPKGGVCGLGTCNTTENGANVILAGGFIYSVANLGVEHLGTAVLGAEAQLFSSYPLGYADPGEGGYALGICARFTRIFNLLGDPSLSMWTDVPRTLSVVRPDTLTIGARSVSLTVTRAADGLPLPDAVVCLWKQAPDSTWITGTTDAYGRVTLPVNVNATGDLMLTITKHNIKPYLYTIPCVQSDCMPLYSSVVLDDDNSGGTSGNGDHLLNPGETIDLPVYVRNFGTSSNANSVTASLSSSDTGAVRILSGSSAFTNIAVGDSALALTPFRVQVSPTLPDNACVMLPLTITSSVGETSGCIPLYNHAGNAQYQRHQFSPVFNPGATCDLTVVVKNMGSAPLSGVSARLIPLSPFVQVNMAAAPFRDLAVGALDSNIVPFSLTANSLAYRGLQAPMRLILTTASGFSDSTQFNVSVGTARSIDPTGPDSYGYYAYDNTDTSYETHPTFSYVNISASGTLLAQASADVGDKTALAPIWSNVVHLPFAFKFYGKVCDSLTVCSNGWCAFGDQGYYDGFRNFSIPGMRAPDAMIAPYWDDLITTGTGHGVWVQSDTTNHRYIIQWKATAQVGNPNLDFEVILLDSTYYPTFSGNGNVLLQYNHAVMNIQPQYTDDAPGCTIGIQAPGGLVGLQYAYESTYNPGSATVTDGRAILFSTDARMLFGTIRGTITNAGDGQPMSGVDVLADGYAYHTVSDDQGHYTIPNVLIGLYNLHTAYYRFNSDSVSNVVVLLDSTTTVDFSLTRPLLSLSAESLSDTVGTAPGQTTFTVINSGNGPADYAIQACYAGTHSPDPWDSVGNINASDLCGNSDQWGCEFAGDYWYVTGAGYGDQNLLYRFDLNGNLAGSIPQPSHSPLGWFDLAYDGRYLYGSDSHMLYGIDTSGVVQDSIYSPLNPSRAIAYDSLTDHFWVADYLSDIYEIDRAGQVVHQVPNSAGLNITGLAWNALDPQGYKLYIFSQNEGSSAHVTSVRPTAPYTRGSAANLPSQVGDHTGGCAITPSWNSTLLVFGGILRGSDGADHLQIYQLTFNSTWISSTPSQTLVPGGSGQLVTVRFDPTYPSILRSGTYHVDMHISSAIYDSTFILPVHLIVDRTTAADKHRSLLPTQYCLHQNYPNPFNPSTQIRFDLPEATRVEIHIYNTLGQWVTTLTDEVRPAGAYSLTWDGQSKSGASVASGLYIYQIRTAKFTDSKKMLLVR